MPRKVRIPPNVALWPALSRFYGLSFTELRKMPRWAVRLYAEEMQVLQAQEQLDALEAVSFPYMEDDERTAVARQYTAIIRHGEQERRPETDGVPTRVETSLPDRAALTGAGIAFVKEAPSA